MALVVLVLLLAASAPAGSHGAAVGRAVAAGRSASAAESGRQRQQALEEAWSKELGEQDPETKLVDYKSPIQRVVSLLKKMQMELSAEGDKEAEMYDKMVCWCETSEKEKTKAVADAEAKESSLEAELNGRQARFGTLATDIDQAKVDIAELTDALKKATAIREKGAEEFRAEETDLVQAIDNLRNAIFVLGKHQGGSSFLQMDASLLTGLRVLLRDAALRYELLRARVASRGGAKKQQPLAALLQTKTGSAQVEVQGAAANDLLAALNVQAGAVGVPQELPLKFAESLVKQHASAQSSSFLQKQPLYASYSSRSNGIYGILEQMLEEFEAELKTEQKSEMTAVADYEALAAAKSAQITATKAKLDEMEAEFAGNQKAISDAQEDLELTRNQRSEDVKYLKNLMLTCNDLDTQWERRSKTRSEETAAVSEALVILTEDDSKDLMKKTVTLLQVNSEETASMRARQARAVSVLRKAARLPDFDADDLLAAWTNRRSVAAKAKVGAGPRSELSTLAVSVQLDSFTKVKEMMDTMVAELKKEQVEEVKFKSYCRKELDQTEKTTYAKNVLKSDLETKLDQLASLMEKLAKEIGEAETQVEDTKTEILKASQNREKENTEFQTLVADQRATQAILKKALTRLQAFYKKVAGGDFLQKAKQTPPVQFNKYTTNADASPVMGLLKQIIEDSAALESDATKGERQAQADYEAMVKGSNGLIAELEAAITAKSKAIAQAKGDSADATMDLDSTIAELESLAQYDADLHAQCDWLMKNFDSRQKARTQEMEAIGAAKAILSGDTISK
jgi:hypothetical protein